MDQLSLGCVGSPTFPWRPSTIAVCRTLPTCTVTWEPRRKVLAWKSSTMAASNWQQMVGFILGLTSTIPCSSQSETRTHPIQSRGLNLSQIWYPTGSTQQCKMADPKPDLGSDVANLRERHHKSCDLQTSLISTHTVWKSSKQRTQMINKN